VSRQVGIDFSHTHGAAGDYQLIETMGAGGAFIDFDSDGWLDIYLVNGHSLASLGQPIRPVNLLRREAQRYIVTRGESSQPRFDGSVQQASALVTSPQTENERANVLYRNEKGVRFSAVEGAAGAADPGYGMGCAVGDVDGDGDSDLYVTNFHRNQMFFNDIGVFHPVPAAADSHWSTSATFVDFDLDGDLDLYVVNYLDYSPANNRICGGVTELSVTTGAQELTIPAQQRTYCSPRYYNGAPDALYRNEGDGTFTDVTRATGMFDVFGKGLGVVAGDFDDDGDPDLFIANDGVRNTLWRNDPSEAGTRFKNVAVLAGVAYSATGIPQAGMGVDAGDVDGDLDLDLFVTNFSRESNALYRNDGDMHFADIPDEVGLGEPSFLPLGFGTLFVDVDNDADLDLFVVNGHVLDRFPRLNQDLRHAQPDQLFINRQGRFVEVPFDRDSPPGVSRGAALGDFDRDGDPDLLVTSNRGAARLYRNDMVAGNWLVVQLHGGGRNPQGLGARVVVHCGGTAQLREVRSGRSYLSASSADAHFGLGTCTRVDLVSVRWPGGEMTRAQDVEVNQYLRMERR
jgi:hypothetical protein